MRILHAADLHLDSPFAALSEEKAQLRRQESRELLRRLAAVANGRGAELVLLSGDLFDSAHVYRETVEALSDTLATIRCPVCIAPGNHDPYGFRSPYTRVLWPENVRLFAAPEIRMVDFGKCVVYGAGFSGSEQPTGLLTGFRLPPDERLQIMCLHGDTQLGPYNPITRQEIAESGLDYLALGHIHRCSGVLREGDTFYAYPGCCEGRGFDETGEKGCLLLEVEKGSVTGEFVPLSRRRYEIRTVDVTGRGVREALAETLAQCREEDILRVVLTGEREEAIDTEQLCAAFADGFFGLELRDDTTAAKDIWHRTGEESLRGLFLQNLRSRYDDAATEEERQTVLLAVKMGLAAIEGREL